MANKNQDVTQWGYAFSAAPGVRSIGYYAEELTESTSPKSRSAKSRSTPRTRRSPSVSRCGLPASSSPRRRHSDPVRRTTANRSDAAGSSHVETVAGLGGAGAGAQARAIGGRYFVREVARHAHVAPLAFRPTRWML